VHFVDDVNLEAAAGWAILRVIEDHLAGLVYLRVRCGVDLDDIHIVAAGDGHARIAFQAWRGRRLV
jgi:hypothetical protein